MTAAAFVASLATLPSPVSLAPITVKWWDMDAAMASQQLSYEEQALAFVAQGLANRRGAAPTLMLQAGFLDFDWPLADQWWRGQLEESGRAAFTNLTASLCGLVDATVGAFDGLVLYENAEPSGTGYTFAMAATVSAQERLLPATDAMVAKHDCLAKLPVKRDLRIASAPQLANRTSAWRYAIDQLLPKSSTAVVFNVYHYDPHAAGDPQSHATLANLDYAVMNNAFVSDLKPDDPEDLALLMEIFARLDPLFDAYGWAHDEHAWTHAVSVAGGTVFCSFASPNLSFWALLPLPPSRAGGTARRLPSGDSGRALDRGKYYVTFETNEGDTPRIVDSAFGSSWASPLRGSVPVAWSVDPLLAERFPALMDYYASTATANDSFIGGVAGAGYVYLGALSEQQLERYTGRVGRLFQEYGPDVADTYGQGNLSTIAKYSRYAAAQGMAPRAYVSQPLWSHGVYAEDAFRCPELNLYSPVDGTPIICTPNTPNLFYRNRGLNATNPAADLAGRIRTAAARYRPPYFITVYGGLAWQPGTAEGPLEFWTLLNGVMQDLGPGFVAVGASEMARLAASACNRTGAPPGPASCAVTSAQNDCSPNGKPWHNSTEPACLALGCCWHDGGVKPSGHYCIKKESPAPTCLKPKTPGQRRP